MSQTTPEAVRLETVYLQDGQYVENVFHYILPVEHTVENLNWLAQTFWTNWDLGVRIRQPASLTLMKIVVTSLESDTAPAVEWTEELPHAGSNMDNPLPNNVTVAVRLMTALRGRSYRGRVYHLGLCEPMVVGNRVDGTELVNLVAAYTRLVTLSNGVQTAHLGVLSRVHNQATRVTGVITPVTQVVIDPIVDSQRRRLPSRGR